MNRWIKVSYIVCSNCFFAILPHTDAEEKAIETLYDFCPRCGARMIPSNKNKQ